MNTTPPAPRLRRWVLPVGIALVVLLLLFLVLLPILASQLSLPTFSAGTGDERQTVALALPAHLAEPSSTYGPAIREAEAAIPPAAAPPVKKPPVMELLSHAPPASLGIMEQLGPKGAPVVPATPQSVPTQEPAQGTGGREQNVSLQSQASRSKPRQPWFITPTDITLKRPEAASGSSKATPEGGQSGKAAALIEHAVWARPAQPAKTLWRSQVLIGDTVDDINSDAPTPIRVKLTIPVFAKAPYDNVIVVDKDSIAILEFVGKPEFGQRALNIKVAQIETPTHEAWQLDGTAGIPDPEVNNHYGKLALATGINAVLSLGLSAMAGTPGPGQYYQNPAQRAAQEAAQSGTNDVRSITQAQLKVPPTLFKEHGAHVTIHMMKNVTFSRRPLVVR
jgi:type IV secretory pathway VirB10-like protein